MLAVRRGDHREYVIRRSLPVVDDYRDSMVTFIGNWENTPCIYPLLGKRDQLHEPSFIGTGPRYPQSESS